MAGLHRRAVLVPFTSFLIRTRSCTPTWLAGNYMIAKSSDESSRSYRSSHKLTYRFAVSTSHENSQPWCPLERWFYGLGRWELTHTYSPAEIGLSTQPLLPPAQGATDLFCRPLLQVSTSPSSLATFDMGKPPSSTSRLSNPFFFGVPLRCVHCVCVSGAWPSGGVRHTPKGLLAPGSTPDVPRAHACPAHVNMY